MSLFHHCDHDWVEKKKTVCDGLESLDRCKGYSSYEIRLMMWGSVTYLFECSKCHTMTQETLIGQEEKK